MLFWADLVIYVPAPIGCWVYYALLLLARRACLLVPAIIIKPSFLLFADRSRLNVLWVLKHSIYSPIAKWFLFITMLDFQVITLSLKTGTDLYKGPSWLRQDREVLKCLVPGYLLRIGYKISWEFKQKPFLLHRKWNWHWMEQQRPGRLYVYPEEFSQVRGP
jgi:hypothetical protein